MNKETFVSQEKIDVLKKRCRDFGLSEDQYETLLANHVYDVYFVFHGLSDWATWYAKEWAWRSEEIEKQFAGSTPDDWKNWIAEDSRFFLLDGDLVVEHDWQTSWKEDETSSLNDPDEEQEKEDGLR